MLTQNRRGLDTAVAETIFVVWGGFSALMLCRFFSHSMSESFFVWRVYTMNTLASLWSSDALTDTRSLQSTVSTTDSSAHWWWPIPAEAKDIVEAVQDTSSVKAALSNVRNNIQEYHSCWFRIVEQMCSSARCGTITAQFSLAQSDCQRTT